MKKTANYKYKNSNWRKIGKNIALFFVFIFISEVHAQVGIGTVDPKATLDVEAVLGNAIPSGILVPRLTAVEVRSMQGKIGADQNSLLVYITETFTVIPTEHQYQEIDDKGYYYYYYDTANPSKSLWKKFSSQGEKITAGAGIEISKGVVSATGLERITENNGTKSNTGWRLIGRNPQYYKGIGEGGVDFSYNGGGNSRVAKGGASGSYSTAMGLYTEATATASIAMGYETVASGTASLAMGYRSKANGNFSSSIGWLTEANGAFSLATGSRSKASGANSFAFGDLAKATATYTIAMGYNANATEEYAVAIGSQTGAYKKGSLVIGAQSGSVAYGEHAMAIGVGHKAYGEKSTTIGSYIETSGHNTIGIGNNLKVGSMASTAMGQYATEENKADRFAYSKNEKRLFVVGNGEAKNSRSDAFTILRNGTTGIGINNFETSYSLSDKGHIDEAKLQVNGLIQSRGISNNNASSENYQIVVANDKNILKTVTKAELQIAFSDVRLKDRIQPIYVDENILFELNPVEYYWNEEGRKHGGNDQLQYGFIAQDIQRIFPNLVNEAGDGYQGVDYMQFIAILTSVLQKKSEKIDHLERMLKEQEQNFEARQKRLEERLEKLEKLIKNKN